MDFKYDVEPQWVRRVKIGTEDEINDFFEDTVDDKTIRSVQILSWVRCFNRSDSGEILITYEEQVNVGTSKETT